MQVTAQSLPEFVPQQINEITEPEALYLASAMQRCSIEVPCVGPVDTAFTEHGAAVPGRPPVVLLHGFDGSLLEFRRLVPELLAAGLHTFAVDLIG
jgi:predicted alpha/beta-fold hydrolase